MTLPRGVALPEASVDGHAIGFSTTPKEILPFPGEGVQYFIDHAYISAVGATGAANAGFLIDRDKGNALLRSEEFDNAAWTKTQCAATANQGNSPFGALTADTVIENSTTNLHYVTQGSLSVVDTLFYTFDVYVRALGRSVALDFGTGFLVGADRPRVEFDIDGIAAYENPVMREFFGATASVERVGGFFRVRGIAQATSTSGAAELRIYTMNDGAINYAGDNASGLLVFGASFRNRDTSNDYVVTTSAAVLTQAALVHPTLLQGTDVSGISKSMPTPLVAERGAPIRVVATATLANAIAGVSGYKHFRRV